MYYAMSVKNNHGMRDMKCTIHGHDMLPCLFSNFIPWSVYSVTNWLASFTVILFHIRADNVTCASCRSPCSL